MQTAVPTSTEMQQYIDGRWVPASSGATYAVINPSDEEAIATVPDSGPVDTDLAVAAARRSFDSGDWRLKSQEQRSAVLLEIADYLEEQSAEWPLLESRNAGAVIRKTTVVDVPLALEHWRSIARQAREIPWYQPLPWVDQPYVSWNFRQREPVGVCSAIIPWNYPLIFAVWKIVPALAMGNSLILKPAPQTPLSALALVQAVAATGLLPPGVLNVITGQSPELGRELVTHPEVDKVVFTGSVMTGRRVLADAAATVKDVTLELGGKSANIVCADADIDLAVDGALFAIFLHQGQMCESGSRLYVHEDIYDLFVERLVAKAKSLRVGNATEYESQMGPLISAAQRQMVLEAVELAQVQGAKLACGGRIPPHLSDRGFFVEPTILLDVDPASDAAMREIFGPVLAVQRWSDPQAVVAEANGTIYGLAGGIWSRNIDQAVAMGRQLRCGTVWINDWHMLTPLAPFGGYQQSGIGKELGLEGLLQYTQVKHLSVNLGTPREERYFYDILLG